MIIKYSEAKIDKIYKNEKEAEEELEKLEEIENAPVEEEKEKYDGE